MSHVNGNDIDDLFRRAAEKYPLRTDGADWNRLVADLEKDPSLILPPASEEGGGRRKRRLLWLLIFLLPLGGAGYFFSQQAGHRSAGTPAPVVAGKSAGQTNAVAKAGTSKSGATHGSGTTPAPGTTSTPEATSGGTSASNATPTSGVTPNGMTPATTARVGNPGQVFPATALTTDRHPGLAPLDRTSGKTLNKASGKTPKGTSGNGTSGKTVPSTDRFENADLSSNNLYGGREEEVALYPSSLSARRAATAGGIDLRVNVPSFPVPEEKAPAAREKKNTHTAAAPKKPSFYVGLIAAPDLSTVKFQSVKGVGTTYGVLLGYSFNSRWAVETGVYLDRKKYYTEGEYFSRKMLPWGNNVNLLTADGVCNMWEIPVNVRYNLSQGPRMKWFATAGLSTYLMSKEKYSYQAENPTTGYKWPGTLSYNKSYQYLFSIVNFSVGFEQRLGNIGNLRLEPYLRMPLAKMGTGSLPIISAGLNIGITRRIW